MPIPVHCSCAEDSRWPGFKSRSGRGMQLNWASGHAMRLNSRTDKEGLPANSLNCERPLHLGIRVAELSADCWY